MHPDAAGVGFRQLGDQRIDRRLVGLRRERAIELQECVSQRLALARGIRQQTLQVALEVAGAAGLAEHRHHLACTIRARVELLPQLRGFERGSALPRDPLMHGRDKIVDCGFVGEVEPEIFDRKALCRPLRRDRSAAGLVDIADQDPVHHVGTDLRLGRWSRLGRRR